MSNGERDAARVLRWRRAVAVLLASSALVIATACKQADPVAGGRGAVAVRVRPVEARAGAAATRYSGAVQPLRQVDLAFKVSGYVDVVAEVKDGKGKRAIQEGDTIKKGTVLAQVRSDDYRQRAASASASVAEAEAAAKQAELDAERAESLFAEKVIPKTQRDAAAIKLEAAKARVASAKAQSGAADLTVGDTALVAPMDGVCLRKSVEVGALVAGGSVGFVIADVSSVKVMFGVPDTVVEKLSEGSPVIVTFEAKPGTYEATVSRVSPSADPKSRVFDVEVKLPNEKGGLKPGMIASLEVPEAALKSESIMLPLTSVVRSKSDPRGFAVYVLSGDAGKETVAARDVELGDVIGNLVVVRKGLDVGQKVVSQGASLLADGDVVRIIP